MEQPRPYDIVVSRAGHDAGQFFVVTGMQEDRLLLCNGKTRKLANPKCKSPKHVRIVAPGGNKPDSDGEIRQSIALAAGTAAAKEERLHA